MKIRPKIPMLLGGNNIWYNGILDYDPTRYVHAYDTSRLVNPLNFGEAWTSRINGLGRGRYVPNPSLSRDKVENIEKTNKYYQNFTNALFNTDGTLSDVGKAYAKLSDNLLPENSLARVYNGNLIRNNWITTNNDTYGRPGKSFNNVKDYLIYERNDSLPGGRHNVFLNKGKRYFYVDNEGKYHWVSPEDANKYLVSEKPVEYGWDNNGVYWEDYELTGSKKQDNSNNNGSTRVETGHKEDGYGINWNKIREAGLKIFGNPNLYAIGRLAGNLINNERVYGEQLKGIKPVLRLTYNTHRQVVGDEATKQAYYRRAVQGLSSAAKPFTSDADRQLAYQLEAKRIGDELRAKGDLADNAEIRRTSDESNQHQWANIQRATEVANTNNASINQANALKHNLLANKHSAQWSSIDNFLQGLEYRQRQKLEKQKAILDLIWMLSEQNDIENDLDYINLLKEANEAWENARKEGKNPQNDENVKKALLNLKNWKTQRQIQSLQTRPIYKSGSKIVYKKKDDLLYKSAKDVVEHFRKMSKLSSDALNRKQPKIEKLTSHPKGKTKKYLQGGVAPFTIYKPVALGGETTTSSETNTSRTNKSDDLDLLKELFKSLAFEGLPSDANEVYNSMSEFMSRKKAFGEELSTDDIAGIYILQLLRINTIKFNKALYDNVSKIVHEKDAEAEYAVDQYGKLAVLDTNTGEISYKKLRDIKEGDNLLTNGDLLNLRAYDLTQAFKGSLLQVASNATSMKEISEFLKSQLPKLGLSEVSIDGYTKLDSNIIKAGILVLKEAPDGDYKFTEFTKELLKQAKMALDYLLSILPKNMKTLLEVNSAILGISPEILISSMIGSTLDSTYKYELTAATGKASDKGSGTSEGLKLDAATALVTGKGYKAEIELNPGSSYAVNVQARFSGFLKPSGENMGAGTTMLEASESTIKGNLDWNKATIGGSKIIPTAYSQIVLNNGEVAGMDLPIDPNNPDSPNLEMLKQLENLDKQLKLNNIEDNELNWKLVNDLCDKLNIPKKYDSSGKLNKVSWKRFAAFLVTTPDTALVNKNVILDMVGIATDQERELYNTFILLKTKDKKFELSDTFLGLGHRDELYKGTVFVPIKENIVAAAISSGQNIYMSLATDLEMREQGYNPDKVKSYKKSEYRL